MKSQRLSQNSNQVDQLVAELAQRSVFDPGKTNFPIKNTAAELREAFSGCFSKGEDENLSLKDEFSAKTIEFVVTECRQFLRSMAGDPGCWQKMGKFLANELWELSRLKEDLAEAEKQVGMVRVKLEEASVASEGGVNQKRVMACAMVMAEKEMRRDHLQNRVSMVIDQFVWRILAGTQDEPGGEILESRLRGVFGAL